MGAQLTPKEIKDHELVTFHKELLENFMKTTLQWGVDRRKKIRKIYSSYISTENIRYFLNRPIDIFLKALLTQKLDSIANYHPQDFQVCPTE